MLLKPLGLCDDSVLYRAVYCAAYSDLGIWHHETVGWLAEELQRADESPANAWYVVWGCEMTWWCIQRSISNL
jgi:hypothetical protein